MSLSWITARWLLVRVLLLSKRKELLRNKFVLYTCSLIMGCKKQGFQIRRQTKAVPRKTVMGSPQLTAVQVRCMILDAWGWCTGMTQRDGTGREEGGGFRMGNTCIPVVDSC